MIVSKYWNVWKLIWHFKDIIMKSKYFEDALRGIKPREQRKNWESVHMYKIFFLRKYIYIYIYIQKNKFTSERDDSSIQRYWV